MTFTTLECHVISWNNFVSSNFVAIFLLSRLFIYLQNICKTVICAIAGKVPLSYGSMKCFRGLMKQLVGNHFSSVIQPFSSRRTSGTLITFWWNLNVQDSTSNTIKVKNRWNPCWKTQLYPVVAKNKVFEKITYMI